ncbi:hypothetical protein ACH5RR_034154 [Cinchona calisaya]|uniref:Uncharacterized protein n=1 Tax=Cinchona calisaya TaxID=153742 RepID=A0ABD2YA14_9GENT
MTISNSWPPRPILTPHLHYHYQPPASPPQTQIHQLQTPNVATYPSIHLATPNLRFAIPSQNCPTLPTELQDLLPASYSTSLLPSQPPSKSTQNYKKILKFPHPDPSTYLVPSLLSRTQSSTLLEHFIKHLLHMNKTPNF